MLACPLKPPALQAKDTNRRDALWTRQGQPCLKFLAPSSLSPALQKQHGTSNYAQTMHTTQAATAAPVHTSRQAHGIPHLRRIRGSSSSITSSTHHDPRRSLIALCKREGAGPEAHEDGRGMQHTSKQQPKQPRGWG